LHQFHSVKRNAKLLDYAAGSISIVSPWAVIWRTTITCQGSTDSGRDQYENPGRATMRRQSVILLSAACLAFSVASASAEDTYPNRPIKVIVPYAPGGATDIVARVVGNEVAKITGQGFVIINKPGAYGLIAVEEMAKSAPDGHTLMIGNVSTNAITPVIYKTRFTINYERDVVPVTRRVDIPAFLLVTIKDNFPVTTVRELAAYVKKNPGKVVYGTAGSVPIRITTSPISPNAPAISTW
jgi:hypothetical protein